MRLNWSKILPESYQAMLRLQKVVDDSKIEHRLIELVKIRASQINGCAFCLDMHTKDAIAIGESQQRIYLLSAWRDAPIYSEREKAALAWCESLTQISHRGAPDEIYQEVEKVFSAEEIAQLTMAIVVINSWNRLSVGFRTPAGDYVSSHGVEERR